MIPGRGFGQGKGQQLLVRRHNHHAATVFQALKTGQKPRWGQYQRAGVDAAVVGAGAQLHRRAGGLQCAQEMAEQGLHGQG